jgi:hypothetical protein
LQFCLVTKTACERPKWGEGVEMKLLLVAAVVVAVAQVCSADIVDIIGYAYYQDYNEPYWYFFDADSAEGCQAYPVDGAIVTLYKRNSSAGWDQYGSTTLTDDGYYIFEDIDTGHDAGDLCTNSAWF